MKDLLRTQKGIAILSLCILTLGFSRCSKGGDLLSQKQITSFVFLKTNNPITTDVIGLVNESDKTITAFVPEGVSLNGLFPTISVSEGATVSPSNEQDFSNPVEYTVTASDGSTNTYTATVSVALSQREILQIILDENPGNTLGWVLQITADLGTLDGVFTDGSGNITALVLPNKNLTKLVPEIGQLAHLTELKLASNEITSIPSETGLLSILETLSLSDNNITSIPAEIRSLINLNILRMEENLLATLPREIGQLTNLTNLELDANNLTSLPSEVVNLHQLERLSLSDNQLDIFPQVIGQLTSLDDLFLDGNSLAFYLRTIEQSHRIRPDTKPDHQHSTKCL